MQATQHTSTDGGSRPQLEAQAWKRAGISRSHAYEMMAAGDFPKPIKVGRASRFVSSEVDGWVAARIAARDAAAAARQGAKAVLAEASE